MLARLTLSSEHGDNNSNNNDHNSNNHPTAIHQDNLSPSDLPPTLPSQPIPIRTPRALLSLSDPIRRPLAPLQLDVSVSTREISWDTETLVDASSSPVYDLQPHDFSTLAPPQTSTATARGRLTALRVRPQHQRQLGPIVYGNGRWVLHPNPASLDATATATSNSNSNRSVAQQALAATLVSRPEATTTNANPPAPTTSANRRLPLPLTHDERITRVQRFLVDMGYSHARQRTLRYDELSASEQHLLATRILAVFAFGSDEDVKRERRARWVEVSGEEGCCGWREFESGVACERCLIWGGGIWILW